MNQTHDPSLAKPEIGAAAAGWQRLLRPYRVAYAPLLAVP
jgi:hypothetical protein